MNVSSKFGGNIALWCVRLFQNTYGVRQTSWDVYNCVS